MSRQFVYIVQSHLDTQAYSSAPRAIAGAHRMAGIMPVDRVKARLDARKVRGGQTVIIDQDVLPLRVFQVPILS